MMISSNASKARAARGFSLIELLVVIAIIAILTAIIFPVFNRIQENARESNTLSHMHDISVGLAMYKLDNKSYPPVLFAYACDGNSPLDTPGGAACNTGDTMATVAGDANAKSELVGLYPEYVRSWQSFTCDSDLVRDAQGAEITGQGGINYPQPNYLVGTGASKGQLQEADGTAAYPRRAYFLKDSFDINPMVSSTGGLMGGPGSYTYIIRYQTNWTSLDANYDPNPANSDLSPFYNDYQRQLRWQNPPANTYVTAVTSHVQTANKLIVLYQSGAAFKVDCQTGPWNPTGVPKATGWAEPQNTPATIAPATVSGGTCSTQTTGGTTCNYVPAQFWMFDAANR